MREILAHISLMTNTQQGRSVVGKEITELHYQMDYWDRDDLNDARLMAFLKVRSGGVAFTLLSSL